MVNSIPENGGVEFAFWLMNYSLRIMIWKRRVTQKLRDYFACSQSSPGITTNPPTSAIAAWGTFCTRQTLHYSPYNELLSVLMNPANPEFSPSSWCSMFIAVTVPLALLCIALSNYDNTFPIVFDTSFANSTYLVFIIYFQSC